ncbi:hypothetical protein M3J09_010356 [Ascochyta lentis]
MKRINRMKSMVPFDTTKMPSRSYQAQRVSTMIASLCRDRISEI